MTNPVNQLSRRAIYRFKRYFVTPIGVIPISYIARFLPRNPIVVEAGAHRGYDTLAMSKYWPSGHIYAFEPVPSLFALASQRIARQHNVSCYPLALGNAVGSARMYVSGGASDASSSLLPPKEHLSDHTDVTFPQEIKINTTTLDAWAEANQITRVDFLWLDMQGYELAALKAAPKILGTVRAIHSEVYLKESYAGVPLYPEVREYLQEQGFRVEREKLPWTDAGNVLFVRETL
jgi:FkbM family methyltransferase